MSLLSTPVRALFLAAFTLVLVLLVYVPGLSGPLVLDDLPNLLPIKRLADEGRLSFATLMADRLPGMDGRPVSMFSFVLNWRLSGDSIWWLKLTNLLIHLLCGLLVGLIMHALLPCSDGPLRPVVLAMWTSAAWLLAPLHVSTVLYTVQRMSALAALFSLASIFLYLLAREALPSHRGKVWVYSSLALLSWALAVFSKQNAAVLPLLLLVIELWILPRAPARAQRATTIALGVLAALPALVLVRRFVSDPGWLDAGYALRDFDMLERLMTQPRVLFEYAGNVLLVPGSRAMGLFHDDVAASTSLTAPPSTLLAIGALALLVCTAVLLRRTAAGAPLGGVLFFLCAHTVEASILPLELYFEHRNYLPAFGLLLALAIVLHHFFGGAVVRRGGGGVAAAFMAGFLVLSVVLCALRVDDWRTWERLVTASASAHPASTRGRAALAVLAIEARDLDAARVHLREVRQAGGPRTDAAIAMKRIIAYCRARTAPTEQDYRALEDLPAVEDDPYTAATLSWMTETLERVPCGGEVDLARVAQAIYRRVETGSIKHRYRKRWLFHLSTARLLLVAGSVEPGQEQLRKALSLAPRSRQQSIRRLLRPDSATR
jgi:hypothetical protein